MLKRCLEFREWINRNKDKCKDLDVQPSAFSIKKLSMYKVPELSIADLRIKETSKRKATQKQGPNKRRKS
jgi:hypothetical protein